MKNHKNSAATLLSLLLTISVCQPSYGMHEKVVKYTYQTVTVSQHLTQDLYFQGTVTPFSTYGVLAPFDGLITKPLGFHYGELLKKGQYLFTIQPTGNVDNYRSTLIAYLNAKRSYTVAIQKFSGQQLLYNDGLLAKNDFTDAQTQLLNEKIAVDQSLLSLQNIVKLVTQNAAAQQSLLHSLKHLNLSDAKVQDALTQGFANIDITAPADGLALTPPTTDNSNNTAQQVLGINSPVKKDQVIVVIGNLTGLKIDINVEEVNIDQLVQGQKVTVTGPAFPQFKLAGTVQNISYQQSSNQYGGGNPTYPATIVVPQITTTEQAIIHAGMTANVAIAIPKPDAIMIPIKAVMIDGNNYFVMKKIGDNLQKTAVTTGNTTLDKITILTGLQNGDTIAIPN